MGRAFGLKCNIPCLKCSTAKLHPVAGYRRPLHPLGQATLPRLFAADAQNRYPAASPRLPLTVYYGIIADRDTND